MLFLLFLVAVVQATLSIIIHLEDIKGKSVLYQAAKLGLLICNLFALLGNWFTRVVKWAVLSHWLEARNLMQAYLGLVGAFFREVLHFFAMLF